MDLIEQAKRASERAYVPYSKFPVGAVLEVSGHLVVGCNVENGSFGLTNCAERTALFSAIAQGLDPKTSAELVIYTPTETLVSPCGACRQVMVELLSADTKITTVNINGHKKSWTVTELLPDSFTL